MLITTKKALFCFLDTKVVIVGGMVYDLTKVLSWNYILI